MHATLDIYAASMPPASRPPTPPLCSPQCRERELRLAILQARDVRLQPQVVAACESEMVNFCEGVEAGAQAPPPPSEGDGFPRCR
jgi:hypothetical protein